MDYWCRLGATSPEASNHSTSCAAHDSGSFEQARHKQPESSGENESECGAGVGPRG